MNYLSVCIISKDENKYLKEFVEYHKLIGVEHFFIYDNESKVSMRETLREYSDCVTVIDFPGKHQQMPSYTHCLNNFGNTSKWIAFIDTDEFLVPKAHDDIKLILKDYEAYGGLGLNWRIFGSSGFEKRPEGLQTQSFTKALPWDNVANTHIKSIVQPEKTIKAGPDPHHFIYKKGFHCVNENSNFVRNAFTQHSTKRGQINHYLLRSKEEFGEKVERGYPDQDGSRKWEEFYQIDSEATEEETSILKFANQLKF